jgi:hypothetical protein
MPKSYNNQPNQIIHSWTNKRASATRLYTHSRRVLQPLLQSVGASSVGVSSVGASSFVGSMASPGVY